MSARIATADGVFELTKGAAGWLLCAPVQGGRTGEPIGAIRGVEKERHVSVLLPNGSLPDPATAAVLTAIQEAWLLELRALMHRSAFPVDAQPEPCR